MEEKVYFPSSNLRLCGIFTVPQKPTQTCIVLCHGITVEKNEGGVHARLAQKLSDAGFAVFRFDFRAHGESEGDSLDLTLHGEAEDVAAAFTFLTSRGYTQFGLLGQSFGGYAVVRFTATHPQQVTALALWNASLDYESKIHPVTPWQQTYWGEQAFKRVEEQGFTEIGSKRYKVGKPLMDEIKSLKPYEELPAVKCPVLFVHGDKDTFVPVEDSMKYANMMGAQLEIIHGAEHGFSDDPTHEEAADAVTVEFFRNNL